MERGDVGRRCRLCGVGVPPKRRRCIQPLAGEFGDEGLAVPIWDEACLVCMDYSFAGERMFGGGLAGNRRVLQQLLCIWLALWED
jgi:hypothetical protein